MSGESSSTNVLVSLLQQIPGVSQAQIAAIAATIGNCNNAFGPQNGPATFNGPLASNGPTTLGPQGSLTANGPATFNGHLKLGPIAAADLVAALGPFLSSIMYGKANGAIPKSTSGSVDIWIPGATQSADAASSPLITLAGVIARTIPDDTQIPDGAEVYLASNGTTLMVLSSYPCFEAV